MGNARGDAAYGQAPPHQQTPRADTSRLPPMGNFAPTPTANRDNKRKRGERQGAGGAAAAAPTPMTQEVTTSSMRSTYGQGNANKVRSAAFFHPFFMRAALAVGLPLHTCSLHLHLQLLFLPLHTFALFPLFHRRTQPILSPSPSRFLNSPSRFLLWLLSMPMLRPYRPRRRPLSRHPVLFFQLLSTILPCTSPSNSHPAAIARGSDPLQPPALLIAMESLTCQSVPKQATPNSNRWFQMALQCHPR